MQRPSQSSSLEHLHPPLSSQRVTWACLDNLQEAGSAGAPRDDKRRGRAWNPRFGKRRLADPCGPSSTSGPRGVAHVAQTRGAGGTEGAF